MKNDCLQNLRSLRDYVFVLTVVDEENQWRLFQGSLVEAVEAESDKPFTQWQPGARELLRCPASGQLYVYGPFTGRCRDELEYNEGRPVLWCATPAHYGGRCVVFENTVYYRLNEDDFKKALARRDKDVPDAATEALKSQTRPTTAGRRSGTIQVAPATRKTVE